MIDTSILAGPQSVAGRFAKLFAGHESVFGVYNNLAEADAHGKKVGTQRRTVRGPVTVDLYEQHLTGKSGLGICPIRSDSTVYFGAIDIDVYAELNHAALAGKIGNPPLIVCRSKSGGAHVYCFTSEPVPAGLMVSKLKEIASMLGHSNAEVFPKQISLANEDAGGNWINLPYFNGLMAARYAVGADGRAMGLEEFLDCAEVMRQSLEWFNRPLEASSTSQEAVQAGRVPISTIMDRALARIAAGEGRNEVAAKYFFLQLRDNGYLRNEAALIQKEWQEKVTAATPGKPPYTIKEIEATIKSIYRKPAREPWPPREPSEEKESAADKLLKLCGDFEFYHSGPARDGYVRLKVVTPTPGQEFGTAHSECWQASERGGRIREILIQRFYEKYGKAPSGESLMTVLSTVIAKCKAGPYSEVNLRFARSRDAIYVDLGDTAWRAVKITSTGWEVVSDYPVLFRRPSGMQALPAPVPGGSLHALRPLLNAGDDKQWTLIVGWLAGVFLPSGSFAHLVVEGPKGSGKTSAVAMLQSFLDPSEAGLSGPPKNEEDAILSPLNTGILAFDNLSGCRADFSDTLCRFSTGAAFRTRTFYENLGLTVVRVQVPCLLNGIDAGIMRDDMMERSITLTLPYIAPTNRVTEAHVWAEFRRVHAGCLGAMLDAVVTGLRNLENTVLPELPRMADLCTWVAACEPALPWKPGDFLKAFVGRQKEASAILLENHELAQAIVELVIGDAWIPAGGRQEVTLDQLYRKLNPVNESGFPLTKHNMKYWPQSAISLSHKLKRLESVLKDGGIEITKLPRKTSVRSLWLIRRRGPQGLLNLEEAA